MKQIIYAIVFVAMTGFAQALLFILVATDVAQAKTCTGMRDNCIKKCVAKVGIANVGNSSCIKNCRSKHSPCMKTGIWESGTKTQTNVKKK